MTCTPFGGAPFSAGPIDPGGATGRAWVDFDGDRKADFCRVLSGAAACSVSTGAGSRRRSRRSR